MKLWWVWIWCLVAELFSLQSTGCSRLSLTFLLGHDQPAFCHVIWFESLTGTSIVGTARLSPQDICHNALVTCHQSPVTSQCGFNLNLLNAGFSRLVMIVFEEWLKHVWMFSWIFECPSCSVCVCVGKHHTMTSAVGLPRWLYRRWLVFLSSVTAVLLKMQFSLGTQQFTEGSISQAHLAWNSTSLVETGDFSRQVTMWFGKQVTFTTNSENVVKTDMKPLCWEDDGQWWQVMTGDDRWL